ncbi:hypothetical protein R1flu_024786 [Riccia fluitans]|uniref:TATA element modulatory factor 1 TATA binding domain-containing protein n=1 Tax=Riccia fluitans TaxID=41844 RepID=A0ABD1XWD3_9MARC
MQYLDANFVSTHLDFAWSITAAVRYIPTSGEPCITFTMRQGSALNRWKTRRAFREKKAHAQLLFKSPLAMASDTRPEGDEDPQAKAQELENALNAAKKDLALRVKHYESKLITMTVINSALTNENEKLKEEVAKFLSLDGSVQEMTELQEEFTKRLGVAERTAANMKEECFSLRQQVEELKKSKDLVSKELYEKQSSIEQYTLEGEKLSKKMGELESILKKCRSDLAKSEQEKEKLVAQVQILEAEAKEADKSRTMDYEEVNLTLQHTRKLLADQKEHFAQALEVARTQAEEDLRYTQDEAVSQLSQITKKMEERERIWSANLDALRNSLSKTAQAASEREDSLREEIKTLEIRLRTTQAAQEEATARLTESTVPLVRQMESLSKEISQREALMEERERHHSYQLEEMETVVKCHVEAMKKAEAAVQAADRRAHIAETSVFDVRAEARTAVAKLQDVEAELSNVKDELLKAEGRVEKAQEESDLRVLKERKMREEAQRALKMAKLEFTAETEGLKKHVMTLKASMEAQEKEFAARLEAMKLAAAAEENSDTASCGSTVSTERQTLSSREAPVRKLGSLSDIVASVMELDPARGGQGLNHVAAERILSQVRRFQGEVQQLHKDLKAAQLARDHASEDLLNVTEKLNKLRKESATAVKLRTELEELKRRHDMALVIIGEQNEKADELEADMADVKALYREQMNLLISQVDLDKWPNGYRICLFCSHCAQAQRRTKRFQ